MVVCLVTFKSFMVQWLMKIAGLRPQLKPLKQHCEKELGNATAKPKQKLAKLTKNMQKVCKTQLK